MANWARTSYRIEGSESDYFETEKQAMAYAAELLGKEEVSKGELKNWNKEHKENNDFIYVHEFEIED